MGRGVESAGGNPVDVWGQTRASTIVLTQSSTELSLATTGGGLSVPQTLQRYRLDRVPLEVLDNSLGDLGTFVRKVRTTASWSGDRLKLETEPFGETVDGSTGKRTRGAGSITSVRTLQLLASGDELLVERTGFRALPPALLHGRPYSQADDLVYNRDVVVYLKSGRIALLVGQPTTRPKRQLWPADGELPACQCAALQCDSRSTIENGCCEYTRRYPLSVT